LLVLHSTIFVPAPPPAANPDLTPGMVVLYAPAITATLGNWSTGLVTFQLFPLLTQIYQIPADRAHGDETLTAAMDGRQTFLLAIVPNIAAGVFLLGVSMALYSSFVRDAFVEVTEKKLGKNVCALTNIIINHYKIRIDINTMHNVF
jgi:hypothetical protein